MIAILAIIITAPVFAANLLPDYGDVAENPNQQWAWRSIGNDSEGIVYEIKSTLSNKCVDNESGSSEDGNRIFQYSCNGDNRQKWVAVYRGSYFNLKNINTRKCIAVSKALSAEGDKLLHQWPCDNENPQWFVNSGRIVNNLTQKCMDDPNGSTENVQLIQWTCS